MSGTGSTVRRNTEHGTHHRRHRRVAHAHHRLRLRQEQARRSRLGADLRRTSRRWPTWLAEKRPDVLRRHLQRPHHARSSSTTTRRSRSASARSGAWPTKAAGARDLPPIDGHPALAAHIGALADGRRVRHVVLPGQARSTTAASRRCRCCARTSRDWPVTLDPAADGRAAVPDPQRAALLQARPGAAPRDRELSARTCGSSIVATGGLSHQVHGERAGFNNPEWDSRFLDLFERDPERLAEHDASPSTPSSAASKAPRSSCGWRCAARCRPASCASTAATTCRR